MDTAFFRPGGRLDEVTMVNAPVTNVPRTATYKIDYIIVVRVLPLSVRFTNALLSLSLLGVNSPPVVVAGTTVE
jgi:hypothetical protein